MNNTAIKYNFFQKHIRTQKLVRKYYRETIKNTLLNKDFMLIQWVEDIQKHNSSLDGIAAYPMNKFTEQAENYSKRYGAAWLCERVYTGKFNPYDDYFMADNTTGDIVSFKKSEYLEWLRRKDNLETILEVIENCVVD